MLAPLSRPSKCMTVVTSLAEPNYTRNKGTISGMFLSKKTAYVLPADVSEGF